jgi:hypothetical protein
MAQTSFHPHPIRNLVSYASELTSEICVNLFISLCFSSEQTEKIITIVSRNGEAHITMELRGAKRPNLGTRLN